LARHHLPSLQIERPGRGDPGAGRQPAEACCTALDEGLDAGTIHGFEKSLLIYQINDTARWAPYVVANVNLWPQTVALLADTDRFVQLTGRERGWLRTAAKDASARSTELADRDAEIVPELCKSGARFANASPAELAAFRQAFATGYAALARDAQTRAFIESIEAIKRSTGHGPRLVIPAGCTGRAPFGAAQQTASPGLNLNGTYRWTLTDQDALAHGTSNDKTDQALAENFPNVFTVTLKDGTWVMRQTADPESGDGTYAIDGDRIAFTWPRASAVLRFTFSLDARGNLRLRPVPPMDAGDQFVWSTKIWTKIG